MEAASSARRNRGSGTVRARCDLGVPSTILPPTSEKARHTSMRRRAKSMSQTRRAVACAGASNRESRAAEGPVISGKGRRGSRRCGAVAFVPPFGRKPYRATSCRARLSRHRPQPVPAVTPRCCATRAGPGRHVHVECADRCAKGHSHWAVTPRIVQAGPSSVKGTPRSFLTASQKGIFGTHS